MTSPVSAVEAIEKEIMAAIVSCAHEIDRGSVVLRFSERQSGHNAYNQLHRRVHDALLVALARQEEALEQRAEAAEALAERLKLEAQPHAMEARTANSTINEIYQIVSGGKGEPGNWHGAEPVRAKLEALQRENAELRRLVENGQSFANQVRSITYRLNGQAYSSTVSELNQFDAVLRRARTLLKEEANAE